MKSFGEQLAEIMALDKITPTDLSRRSGVSYATIYNLLRNGKTPSYTTLGRIVQSLQLDVMLIRPEREPLLTLKARGRKKKGNVPKGEQPKPQDDESINFDDLGIA